MQHSQPGSNIPPRRIKGQFVRSQLRICDSGAHEEICLGEVVIAGGRDSAAQSLSHEAVECGPGVGAFELGKDSLGVAELVVLGDVRIAVDEAELVVQTVGSGD